MGETKKFLSDSLIVFIGSTVASVFSYLFNMLMGRMLGPAQYGEMAAILSLLMIVSVGGGVITTTTMYYVGEMYGLGNYAGIRKLLQIFTRSIFFLSISFFLVGAVFAGPIAHFFGIDHVVPVIIGFSSLIFGFLIVVSRGILQGTQSFGAFTVTSILEMALRVTLAVVFVRLGFALNGAIAATVIATVITYFVTFVPLQKLWKEVTPTSSTVVHFSRKEVLTYTVPVFASALCLATLLNLDVILVKHYFPTEQAGLYAAISTVAKIILYITSPIIAVMFPMIMERRSRGEKHYKMLLFSLGLTVIGAVVILAFYNVIPALVVRILYGRGFVEFSYLLPQLGIFVLFYTLVNLLANYFLAIKNFIFLIFMVIALVLVLVWSSLSHNSLPEMISVFIISTALLFLAMIGYYLFIKKTQILQYLKGRHE